MKKAFHIFLHIYYGFTDERFFRIVMLTAVIIFGSLIQHRLERITNWTTIGTYNTGSIRSDVSFLRGEVDPLNPNPPVDRRLKQMQRTEERMREIRELEKNK